MLLPLIPLIRIEFITNVENIFSVSANMLLSGIPEIPNIILNSYFLLEIGTALYFLKISKYPNSFKKRYSSSSVGFKSCFYINFFNSNKYY